MSGKLFLIGIGADGCPSLTSRAINAVAESEVLAGTEEQLAFFPQFAGQKVKLSMPIDAWVIELMEQAEDRFVSVLASGDPMFFGIGQTLVRQVIPCDVEVIPNSSCVQLACARLYLPCNEVDIVSLHGQVNAAKVPGLVARMQHANLLAVLTDKTNTPVAIANYLVEFGELDWRVAVCEDLGSCDEKITEFSPKELAAGDAGQFSNRNILLLQRHGQPRWHGCKGHRPDDEYLKRMPKSGLITKAPVRAVAVANLCLQQDSVVWDIGAGSGSVGIEAAKIAYRAPVFAIECTPQCWPQIEANRVLQKVDNLRLVQAKAPEGLAALPAPDAVFCGGSRGQLDELLPLVWRRLRSGGRMVFSAVTLETVAELSQLAKKHQLSAQMLLIQTSQERAIGPYVSYQANNPIHLFIFEKPEF
ncbi:precorrin-6y C5,15-methyltransferase (decarboxylating) subunit CbiE [Ferrimonas lipolytica]|uniref:Precorrin-6y C5,15-methyltransferase (Decarboxylating) subunit CbiE n=1 Tax=Ferrimonas lipolytica TaxID=2724191 RepID=A0A6H1UCD9_9GAMM|nr:precorrin-6y C5,15-methyltransferase (decarboxylating) subunit CbiE [Ferrimonas lipolytica]QIZ76309.1 precorrin-6y C5,15-methyltransferase (decarboxylating) subunit CbiE [Ferrimonas lipolytica]